LGDKGYIGQANETNGLRKITPVKNPTLPSQKAKNKELGQIRVAVERFFGHMTSHWAITRNTYRYSHENFDDDMDICILLTNEHLKIHNTSEQDGKFFQSLMVQRMKEFEKKEEKRRAQLKNYATKRRRELLIEELETENEQE
jgi:hypothetical protein